MYEDINILEKNVENCFDNNFLFSKNIKFKAYFYRGDENTNNMHIIYDKKNYVYCLINIPKNKEYILNEKNEYEITINDSSYDIFFYKNKNIYNNNNINCILILIINDIDINYVNENYLEFKEEKYININQQDKIINQIKLKITDYIKTQKENNNNCGIQHILIGEKENNFLINKNLLEDKGDNNDNSDSIKIQIEKLSKLPSKVEIRNENNNFNNFDINNIFMNVYEVLSPTYKSTLSQKYLNEMPNNLYNLMDKYHEVNINKNDFDKYKINHLVIKKPKIKDKINKNNINIIHNNHKYFRLIKKKIKKSKIFKLKKSNKKRLIINIKKINSKEKKLKKKYFKIHRHWPENKEENKNENNIINKMIIEEKDKIFEKKKNIFKCVSISMIKRSENKNNLFIIKK